MSLAGQTVLVTGATGFLGRALVDRLLTENANVRALARSYGKADRLSEGVQIHFGDITEPETLAAPIADATIVFHVAAALGGDLAHQRRVNRDGTRVVAEAAAAAGTHRMVHVSTLAVYGFQGTEFPETREPTPSPQAYATTKAEAEQALREVAAKTGLEYSIIRPTGIFGPGSWFWTAGFLRRAARRPTIFVGKGKGTLPVVFVDDAVDLMTTQATHPAAADEIFNCCLNPSPSVREYHQAYGRLVDRDGWVGIPMPLARAGTWAAGRFARRHSYLRYAPELLDWLERPKTYPVGKAKQLLDWAPRYDLERGVAACVPWLQEKGLLTKVQGIDD